MLNNKPPLKDPCEELNEELSVQICSFLDSKDIVKYSLTNKKNYNALNGEGSIGSILRNNSPYSVVLKDENNTSLFLEEYLALENSPDIKHVKNIGQLAKKEPKKFVEFILKATPKTPNAVNESLESFYLESIGINSLINSLPVRENSSEKLASAYIEKIIWTRINHLSLDQVAKPIRIQLAELWNEIWQPVMDRINSQFTGPLRNEAWREIGTHIETQVKNQVNSQVWHEFQTQVTDKIENQVNENLKHFDFLVLNEEIFLNQVKAARTYTLMNYQLASITMRHSQEIIKIQDDLSKYLSNHLNPDQIELALENIRTAVPQEDRDQFIKFQLKILHKQLD